MTFYTDTAPMLLIVWGIVFSLIGLAGFIGTTRAYTVGEIRSIGPVMGFLLCFAICSCLVVSTLLSRKYEVFTDREYNIEQLAEYKQAIRYKGNEKKLIHSHYLLADYWVLYDPDYVSSSSPQPSNENPYKDFLKETQ